MPQQRASPSSETANLSNVNIERTCLPPNDTPEQTRGGRVLNIYIACFEKMLYKMHFFII
uniref:Uncharacterized protein n=1 Tax=Anguilla anguilla TaxID=7936 RepID=A0A0E9V1U0_ANGAN